MIEERKRILPKRKTADGWAVVRAHWSCVPDYKYDEIAQLLGDRRAIQAELEINWNITPGLSIYHEFNYERHVALEPLVFDPGKPLHCGWDWADTGTPAFVPTQLNAFGQWQIFPALSPAPGQKVGVYEFFQEVADHLLREYASPHELDLKQLRLIHIGDPAGRNRLPRTGERRQETRSCFEVLDKGSKIYLGEDDRGEPVYEEKPGWGWRVIPGAVSITDRLEAVRSRLTTLLRDGVTALVVDPRAESVIRGFEGGYCYKQYSDGTYSKEPLKNWWSHQFDCIGYVGTRLFAKGKRTVNDDEDEDRPKRQPFVSHAASGW